MFAFQLHAINRDQLFSKKCKMLIDDVIMHILLWSLMNFFLCVLKDRKMKPYILEYKSVEITYIQIKVAKLFFFSILSIVG
jgi:hypothetical protein